MAARPTREDIEKLYSALIDMQSDFHDIQNRLRTAEQAVLALTEGLKHVQELIEGPLHIYIDRYPEFHRMLSTGLLQSQDEIETVAERILREKFGEALDTVAEDMKNEILRKIQKQSTLW